METQVIRSHRRRKTVQARMIGGVLRVSIPAAMSVAEERRWVAEMVRRMERRTSAERIDLEARAAELSRRYGLEPPRAIRWVDNQERRWGSCTPADATIRVSSRLAKEPLWVIDYVIVHELAHLSVFGHTPAFWKLVYRYPLTERARGFLMARSGGESGDESGDESWPEAAASEESAAGDADWPHGRMFA